MGDAALRRGDADRKVIAGLGPANNQLEYMPLLNSGTRQNQRPLGILELRALLLDHVRLVGEVKPLLAVHQHIHVPIHYISKGIQLINVGKSGVHIFLCLSRTAHGQQFPIALLQNRIQRNCGVLPHSVSLYPLFGQGFLQLFAVIASANQVDSEAGQYKHDNYRRNGGHQHQRNRNQEQLFLAALFLLPGGFTVFNILRFCLLPSFQNRSLHHYSKYWITTLSWARSS